MIDGSLPEETRADLVVADPAARSTSSPLPGVNTPRRRETHRLPDARCACGGEPTALGPFLVRPRRIF